MKRWPAIAVIVGFLVLMIGIGAVGFLTASQQQFEDVR